MTATFAEMEENILKMMDNKQNISKELEKMITDHSAEYKDMEIRERQVRKERDLISSEKEVKF